MPTYSFRETLDYFGEKLNARPPEEDLEAEEVELNVDQFQVIISKGLKLEVALGMLLHTLPEEHLKELATSNFLGVNTGGCTFAIEDGTLKLIVHLTPASTPQESWEWLHRMLHVAVEWNKTLNSWEEFIPLTTES